MIGLHLGLAEVAPLAPAAAGVLFGLATLATLLGFIACWGLRHAWGATIGYGLRWIASEIRGVSIPTGFFGSLHPFGRVADVFEAVDHYVAHALAVAALNMQHAFVYCAHTTAHIFVWTGEEIARIAMDMYHFAVVLDKVWIPRALHDAYHAAKRAIEIAIADARRFNLGLIHSVERLMHAIETRLTHRVRAVAGTLEHVIPRVRGLERDVRGIRARLKQLEHLLSPAAFAALVAAAVATIAELRFIRCREFKKLNNDRGCGLWSDLEALLGVAFIAAEVASLEELIGTAQKVTDEVVHGVEKLLNV